MSEEAPSEPVEAAKTLLSGGGRGDSVSRLNAAMLLEGCDQVHDLEHVEWLVHLASETPGEHDKPESHSEDNVRERLQAAGLRLVTYWARGLQANVAGEGAPIEEPLRDELIDSAVTFLEDPQVAGRSVAEKVTFLQDKGLNRTEIRVALAQAGIEAPSSLQFADTVREEQVANGTAFLGIPEIKAKPLEERLAFLKSKGLTDGEIVLACEKAGTERIPTPEEMAALKAHRPRSVREDLVKNGAEFLTHKSVAHKTLRERLVFLKSKGLIGEEIRQACSIVGISLTPELEKEFAPADESPSPPSKPQLPGQRKDMQNSEIGSSKVEENQGQAGEDSSSKEEHVRSDMVEKGVTFLKHPAVQRKPASEKMAFLRGKGLTEAELEHAFKQAGVASQYVKSNRNANASRRKSNAQSRGDPANVDKAIAFLSHPSSQQRSMREKVQFLRSKGLSMDEIKQACEETGMPLNGSTGSLFMNDTAAFSGAPNVGLAQNYTASEEQGEEPKDDSYGHEDSGESTKSPKKFGKESAEALRNRRKRIELAKGFLLNEKSASASAAEKVRFLSDKGLTSEEISEAFFKTGLVLDETDPDIKGALSSAGDGSEALNANEAKESSTSDSAVTKAANFLKDDKTARISTEDKIVFLRQQGLSDEQITAGFKEAELILSPEDFVQDTAKVEEAREKRVASAISFLQKSATSNGGLAAQKSFLREKGLADVEIKAAFERAGLDYDSELNADVSSPNEQKKLIDQGVAFLSAPSIKSQPVEAKMRFLASKGLSRSDIEETFRLAGLHVPEVPAELSPENLGGAGVELGEDGTSQKMVEMGRGFLQNPATATYSGSEKADFLRDKGLNEDEVAKAFRLAGMSESAPGGSDSQSVSMIVQRAVQFLSKTRAQHRPDRQVEFLREKGLNENEIDRAFQLAGVDRDGADRDTPATSQDKGAGVRIELVEQASGFLQDPSTESISMKDRVQFLRNKGLNQEEIERAFQVSGVSVENEDDPAKENVLLREDFVSRGAAFLVDPSMSEVPLEDRVEYLQKQGLTGEEVLQAAIRAKVDLVPSYISTIPSATLKRERFQFEDGMPTSGRTLQRAINCATDILLHVEKRFKEEGGPKHLKSRGSDLADQAQTPSDAVAARAMALLATALSRSRAAKVVPACVAFSARIVPIALERSIIRYPSDKSNDPLLGGAATSQLLEDFCQAHMELVARATQIDIYAKTGLQQMKQVKLHFITPKEILNGVLQLWRRRSAVDFSHGIVLARAAHGEMMSAAAYQPFTDATGPVMNCIVEHLVSTRDDCQDVAAYVAAGMLRGAPDYAWAKDITESPQPRMESAMHAAADAAVRRFESAQDFTATADLLRAKGVVTAVGLASVYCDTQIQWDTAIIMAVTEGLLNGALDCQDVLKPESQVGHSLDARVAAGNAFTETEIFKLAPQLVSLLLQKLPPRGIHDPKTPSPKSQLCSWMVERLHRFSTYILASCRESPALCGIVARRTVHLVYGTGQEAENQEEEKGEEEEENGEQLNKSKSDDDSQETDSEQNQEEEDDDDDEEEQDELEADQGDDRAQAPVDPMEQFLGVHSGIARTLQMSYLSSVLIGAHCITNTDFDSSLLMLDVLGNLNAFQVRVQDAVDLESLLAVLIGLYDNGSSFDADKTLGCALLVFKLLQKHVDAQETAATPQESTLYDWVLGARVEFILGLGEQWLLPSLIRLGCEESAVSGTPSVPEHTADLNLPGPLTDIRKTLASTVLDLSKAYEQASRHSKSAHKLKRKKARNKPAGNEATSQQSIAPIARVVKQQFSAGMCKLLLRIGVPHPFVHLNHRAHRWMINLIDSNDRFADADQHENANALADKVLLLLPTRLACVPHYVSATLESYPNTPTRTMSFAIASVLTSLGCDPDPRAQPISFMAFEKMALIIDSHMSGRAQRPQAGPTLCTLMFTALKAIPLPALPSALESTADIIARSPPGPEDSDQNLESELGSDLDSLVRLKPLTQEWMLESLFGVITRTDDAPRRLILCQWYLRDIQNLTVGGKL